MPPRRDPVVVADTPLRWHTPATWLAGALSDVRVLLNDHAHLERKAAGNALELLSRWPYPIRADRPVAGAARWARRLTAVARDEVGHLAQVLRHLEARGGALERCHASPYAAALRGLVRTGRGRAELVDRLLVSALIEARSAERFALLAAGIGEEDLRAFYGGLLRSEAGHVAVFLDLAALVEPRREQWEGRWSALLDAEAVIAAGLPPGPSLHSGPPRAEDRRPGSTAS